MSTSVDSQWLEVAVSLVRTIVYTRGGGTPGLRSMEYMIILVTASLGWLFLTAGIEKLINPSMLASTIQASFPVFRHIAKAFVRSLALVEAIVGVGLLVALGVFLWIALLMLGFFLLGTLWLLYQGRKGDCGCGGLMPTLSISARHVTVIALILTLTLTVGIVRNDTGRVGVDIQVGAAIASLALLFAVARFTARSERTPLEQSALFENV